MMVTCIMSQRLSTTGCVVVTVLTGDQTLVLVWILYCMPVTKSVSKWKGRMHCEQKPVTEGVKELLFQRELRENTKHKSLVAIALPGSGNLGMKMTSKIYCKLALLPRNDCHVPLEKLNFIGTVAQHEWPSHKT